MLVGDIASLEPGSGILSVLTDEDGGIVEDTIITNVGDEYVMTIHDRYEEHFSKHMDLFKGEVFMEYLQHSILAVQAPDSPAAMSKVLPLDFDLERLAFMSSCEVLVGGIDECRLARCGFTGEDGFEIHICPTHWRTPTSCQRAVLLKDTLRLEAGICSKGKELHEVVNRVEASLGWTIARRRRQEGGFPHELWQVEKGDAYLRVHYMPNSATGGLCQDFRCHRLHPYWRSSSAAFSPYINAPIAVPYIGKAFSKPGTDDMVKTMNETRCTPPKSSRRHLFQHARFHKIPEVFSPVRDPATGEEFQTPRIVANNDESKVQQPYVNDVGPMKK